MSNLIKYKYYILIGIIVIGIFIYNSYKPYKIIYIPDNPGQITMESSFGKGIFNICNETNYRNIIELVHGMDKDQQYV